ncbi:hypothetical protein INR49_029156 [Caranx melampygus]|nr:hypothetical protein INR49_029156 [Caranx melampygus]
MDEMGWAGLGGDGVHSSDDKGNKCCQSEKWQSGFVEDHARSSGTMANTVTPMKYCKKAGYRQNS